VLAHERGLLQTVRVFREGRRLSQIATLRATSQQRRRRPCPISQPIEARTELVAVDREN
jgi:hypothetical protein